MVNFFKRLNPNVVFVTIIALIVMGAYVGRQEYLGVKRTLVEANCAREALSLLRSYEGDNTAAFDTFTSLCIQSGGIDEYQKWVERSADEKAKAVPPNPK